MTTPTRKGYGRLYCENPEHIPVIKEVMRQLSLFEFDYMPDGFIAPFSEYPDLVYLGKFDEMDMNAVVAQCWRLGARVWYCDNGHEEYMTHERSIGNQEDAPDAKTD